MDRSVDAFATAVFTNRLCNRQNVGLGECGAQRSASMPARSKADQLIRIGRVRTALVILPFEARRIDQHIRRRLFPGHWREIWHNYGEVEKMPGLNSLIALSMN